ncbi:unnamed protein product [Rotaria sp. Silwood1]|nr:unnamed protein product [Rotaria sp. Silwood1]
MSESTTTKTAINLTPSIRSVADQASSIISSNQNDTINMEKNLNSFKQKSNQRRSSSSSVLSSSYSTDSVSLFTANQDKDDEDGSSNDDTNEEWAHFQERLNTVRLLSKLIEKSTDLLSEQIIKSAIFRVQDAYEDP